ncbi:hypothetical protein ABH924_003281 [Arthrobacter sp. GAS37]|uniref:zinc finger domain-containing protein n=1 Tax=Arthrobacter sp. GAS37 TaxID=3156261 RepID=UPI0038347097
MEEDQESVRRVTCPYCQAKPGEPCQAQSTGSHSARWIRAESFSQGCPIQKTAQTAYPDTPEELCEIIREALRKHSYIQVNDSPNNLPEELHVIAGEGIDFRVEVAYL